MTREQRVDFYNRFYWVIIIGIAVVLGLVSFAIYEYRMGKAQAPSTVTQEEAQKALEEVGKYR